MLYNVRVEIESNSGEFLALETQRNFAAMKEVMLFASGFADGFAMAHDGAVIVRRIEQVN